MTTYVLDACAMLAVLSNEPGADVVEEIYEKADSGEVVLTINKVNLLEVYYDLFRTYGKERADEIVNEIRRLPIQIFHEISDDVFAEAGRLKASHKISLADSIALAQTLVISGELLTADHHEFDTIEGNEPIVFHWIR
ncbi:MAG: type II toxin-antitoxin system VapC family toxin [Clostridiales bacterium]|nr:type II toxin-antitoxin system VapC family toxin [Clostridiales bacterium]